MGHNHAHTLAGKNKRRPTIVFGLTTLYLVVEVIGGLLTRSLALLADAGHMLTDVAGLGLALLAIWFAKRPAMPQHTYGFYRVEILASLANAVVLVGISFYILYEAYERFRDPPEVQSGTTLLVAFVSLIVNIIGIHLLGAASEENLNMRGHTLKCSRTCSARSASSCGLRGGITPTR
jgi:cobalt-zinc-cadmium efflux system protein